MRLGDAINAMMDGETVVNSNGLMMKLKDGETLSKSKSGHIWALNDATWQEMIPDGYELVPKEYPLNDWQALKAMHEGRGVIRFDLNPVHPEENRVWYICKDGYWCGGFPRPSGISLDQGKWRIVDECSHRETEPEQRGKP